MGRGLLYAAAGLAEGVGTAMKTKGAQMREDRLMQSKRNFRSSEGDKSRTAVAEQGQFNRDAAQKRTETTLNAGISQTKMKIESAQEIAKWSNSLSETITRTKIDATSKNLLESITAKKEMLKTKIGAEKDTLDVKVQAEIGQTIMKLESAEKQLSEKLNVSVNEGALDRTQKDTASQRKTVIGANRADMYGKPGQGTEGSLTKRGLLPPAPPGPPPAPSDIKARVEGQRYTAANGKIVEWDGKGWKVVG